MKLLSIGYDFRHGDAFELSRPNGLNEYLLLIIRSRAVFEMNGEAFELSPDSMILVDKNEPHSFRADHEVFINDWITFDLTREEHAALFDRQIKLNTFFHSYQVGSVSNAIKMMQDEVQSVGAYKTANLYLLFDLVLNKLKELSTCLLFDKKYYRELELIRNEIYAHPQGEYSVAALALHANLSRSYFQYLYRSYFHVSPIADVINSRVEYSKQLLASTECSVTEISELCGYKSSAQFIKQFKLMTKTTPFQYRKQLYHEARL